MKRLKRIISIFLILLLILAAIFALGRYSRKLLGFRVCEEAGIESVEVGGSTVKIKGFYPGSFPEGFCGYYAEEQDGILYVGFAFSAVFGLFETGDFDVTIPVKGEIQEVILKTGQTETSIWTADADEAAAERCGVFRYPGRK